MPKVFISYRRDDSAYPAHQIQEALSNHLGVDSVVFDVDSIPPAVDFRKYLDEQVRQCDVLLAVIGDQWLRILNERCNDPRDFVRIEIEAALRRDIPVMPVFVGRASRPEEEDLPGSLAELPYRNGMEVRAGVDLKDHLQLLLRNVDRVLRRGVGASLRDTLRHGSEGPEMVIIEFGTFRMGDISDDAEGRQQPVHEVRFVRPFAMGRYPVTFEEYEQFAQQTKRSVPNDEGWGRKRQPVINVSWRDAVAYAEWLSEQTSKRYRLPTEAEWEYAARAGTTTRYWWGDEVGQNNSNCQDCGSQWDGKQAAPVGSFAPNAFGLYDTAGNVWERVQDCWHSNYKDAPCDGSAWLDAARGQCDLRVIRGGSWNYGSASLRSSNRGSIAPALGTYAIGFRVARDL